MFGTQPEKDTHPLLDFLVDDGEAKEELPVPVELPIQERVAKQVERWSNITPDNITFQQMLLLNSAVEYKRQKSYEKYLVFTWVFIAVALLAIIGGFIHERPEIFMLVQVASLLTLLLQIWSYDYSKAKLKDVTLAKIHLVSNRLGFLTDIQSPAMISDIVFSSTKKLRKDLLKLQKSSDKYTKVLRRLDEMHWRSTDNLNKTLLIQMHNARMLGSYSPDPKNSSSHLITLDYAEEFFQEKFPTSEPEAFEDF